MTWRGAVPSATRVHHCRFDYARSRDGRQHTVRTRVTESVRIDCLECGALLLSEGVPEMGTYDVYRSGRVPPDAVALFAAGGSPQSIAREGAISFRMRVFALRKGARVLTWVAMGLFAGFAISRMVHFLH